MSKHASSAVAPSRAHRNRFILLALAAMAITASAAIAGVVLVSNGGGPILTTVSHYNVESSVTEPPALTETVTIPEAGPPQPTVEVANDDDVVVSEVDEEIRWFNNRPIRPVGTMSMLVTAYSPDERSCGKWADGITASGYSVWTNGMNSVAADTSVLPFGSLVSIPGYDNENVVPVLDRGGAIKGKRLDVLYPTHERAMQWGVQRLEVTIWEYADGKPNGFRQSHRRR